MKVVSITLLFFLFINSLQAQLTKIPFELERGLIYIKVKINNLKEEKTFVFDTGATSNVLDASTAAKLGLKANYQQEASGAGGTKTYDIVLSQKLTLDDNISIDNTPLILSDLSRLKSTGKDFDGIIGYSVLNKYITKIDYQNKEILLYNKIQNIDLSGYKPISFEFKNGIPIPQFDISITLRNDESFKGKIFFDSGAAITLLINTPFNKKHQLNKKVKKSLVSKSENLHGESISEVIPIKSVKIGEFNLSEMPINIAQDKAGVSSYDDYLGILGGEIISKFNVILDYSSSILYLKPNKSYHKPFQFPVSGIKLRKKDGDIVVSNIDKTCSAYKKGIRKGDKLIAINNNNSKNLKVYKSYLEKEGSEISLKILDSKEQIKYIHLKLKRLL